jgi:Domain of unknown function (DUF5668)
MNCANHPDIAPVAYCRTCGKPLCANCTRDVKGVIYCENCLADRLQGVQPTVVPPAAGFVSPASAPITPGSGPNPALAGILGAIPFGVGAVYNGQYAKGLAHLTIFALLVLGENVIQSEGIQAVLGVGMAFFVIYQIIDAVRTARAIQMGQPPPDPFGLAQAFGGAEPIPPGQSIPPAQAAEATLPSRIPTAAVVLIGLGVLFLLQTAGVFEFGWDRVWPFFLIGLGIWMFAVREGWVGSRRGAYYRSGRRRTLVGPVVLVTVGFLSLLESYNGPRWHRTWPVLLLAIGITKLLESRTPPPPPPMPPGPGPTGSLPSDVQAPTTEVRNG